MATPLMLKTVRDEEFDQEKNAKIKRLIWLQTLIILSLLYS